MNSVLNVIGFIWAIRIFMNVLSYASLWFVKEYRFDRMLIHLKTKQGQRMLFPPMRRPPISPRALVIVFGTLGVSGLLFFSLPFSPVVTLGILDICTFPITGLMVFISKLPVFILHAWNMHRARQVLRAHRPMIVIGITGSYGKTSTKEYLASILSTAYTVFKTEASKNSPIGIAENVLKNLLPEHEIFVVEMGAYKKGEIATMANMVHPEIGIITAINEQHQDLFGTIHNTMQAKYELISHLTGKKIAIFNADNDHVQTMATWAQKEGKTVRYYTKNKAHVSLMPYIWAESISQKPNGLSFVVWYGKKKRNVTVGLLGNHQVSNVLAALSGALSVGMTFEDATDALSFIRPMKKTLEPLRGIHDSFFIDDTFNNNPDAALAAIEVLFHGTGRKILVFQPMIELGTYAQSAHERVGAYAGQCCDEIILTNENFLSAFQKGVAAAKKQVRVRVLAHEEAVRFLSASIRTGDTVLFKGKESERILTSLRV